MDDLHKEALSVWKLRIKLEIIKKKISRIDALMETEEFSSSFSLSEREQIKKDMRLLKNERIQLESNQLELEEKIGLPNPYLKD